MSKNVLHFSPNNSFDKEVLQESKTNLVMVDFFATWCGPCKKLSPILEEESSKYGFKLVVVDVEQNNSLAGEFEVRSIPYVILFHKGSKTMEFVGFDTNKLQDMINYIKKNTNKFIGKGVSVGGGNGPQVKNYSSKDQDDIPEEPFESDNTYELSFRYNNDTFSRRFLCLKTIGQVKDFIRKKNWSV